MRYQDTLGPQKAERKSGNRSKMGKKNVGKGLSYILRKKKKPERNANKLRILCQDYIAHTW